MRWLKKLPHRSLMRSYSPVAFAVGDNLGGNGGGSAGGTGEPSGNDDDKKFSQDEVNRIVTERVNRALAKFNDVDVAEYQKLKDAEEKRKTDREKEKGNFEKILKETVEKKDSDISRLQNELRMERVDNRLLRELSEQKAISPEQGVMLLKSSVRVTDAGQLEVVDTEGKPRYKGAEPFGVKELVTEFLEKNPHFAPAGPSGSGSRGAGAGHAGEVKLDDLDLSKPEDRNRYREQFRKDKKLYD